MGYGQPSAGGLLGIDALDKSAEPAGARGHAGRQNPLAWELARNLAGGRRGFCQFQSGIQRDFALAAIALADRDDGPPESPFKDGDEGPRSRT